MTPDPYAEIDAILAPVKAAHPVIPNDLAVGHLPERLRPAFWRRAVERHVAGQLAELGIDPAEVQ